MSDAGDVQKKTVPQQEIVLRGRCFESVDSVKLRFGVAETQIKKWQAKGSPPPLKVGSRRYYDRDQLETWLLTLV